MKIKNMHNGETIVNDFSKNLKDCLEKNRILDFSSLNADGALLSGANLSGMIFDHATFAGASLYGADLSNTSLISACFMGADTHYINLSGASVFYTNFAGCNLESAKLDGLKNYYSNHYIFFELIGRCDRHDFTEFEWSIIGKVILTARGQNAWRGGWYENGVEPRNIKEDFGEKIISIYEKLSDKGFGEFLTEYKKRTKLKYL